MRTLFIHAAAAKLTLTQVKRARKMRESGNTVTKIAAHFGVAKSTMSAALSGKNWRDD